MLAEKPELAYALVLLEGLDPDDLQKRARLPRAPIRLSDGRQVGVVLSSGRAPADVTLDGVRYPQFETTVAEIVWANPQMAALAKKATLEIREDGVRLVGAGAGRVQKATGVPGSGWGQRLVAGQRLQFR